MELLTRQRPTSIAEEDGVPVTLNHVVERGISEHKVHQVLDPSLLSSITEDQEKVAEGLLKLALVCASSSPQQRPDIQHLLSSLRKLTLQ